MSLPALLDRTGTVERPTGAVSSMGGKINAPFVTVTGKDNMLCAVWAAGSQAQTQFAQFAIKGNCVLAFAADPTAKPGDRVTIGTLHYLVNGTMTFGNAAICPETLYLIDATLHSK